MHIKKYVDESAFQNAFSAPCSDEAAHDASLTDLLTLGLGIGRSLKK